MLLNRESHRQPLVELKTGRAMKNRGGRAGGHGEGEAGREMGGGARANREHH